ncbi:MAG TPA: DUF3883 domain-containing protein [Acidimicrobiales bacterium]|nr:DUF3883 domain-containing protein [Acidimicrobiales bacterium]
MTDSKSAAAGTDAVVTSRPSVGGRAMLDQDVDERALDFRFRVGTSLLAEFAMSHNPADVLRELVQNEYDAAGTELTIEFGVEALVVRGNGANIDNRGWKRLGVMLGTGHVAGEAARIEAKTNGIGSKNFGLRSLFLFGDRIHVASGGRRTILDWSQGTLDKPLPDPQSAGSPGVIITVPYRRVAEAPLQAFDEAYERQALKTISAELAPTLVKLAQPGAGKNLRSVTVRSERLGQELRWRQTARAVPGVPGLVRRSIRLAGSGDSSDEASTVISEAEYQVVLAPPPTLPKRDLPRYFRVSGGRIRLGISFRVRRDRLDLRAAGVLYYPLSAGGSRTGFPFSVSAPFEMTEDRSNIVDPQNSSWNAWLVDEAARFAVKLLPDRLFETYGADAFVALTPRSASASTVPALPDEIRRLLGVERCWPTLRRRRGGRPVLAAAGALVVPAAPALSEFVAQTIPSEEVLDRRLAERADVRALAAECGAKTFTVGSLIRLRCAGADPAGLATRLDAAGEAARAYPDFPAALADLSVQRRFAAAFDACRTELKDSHKSDLRRSPTTMTAAGTLAAPSAPLWTVDEALAGIAPRAQTLHPELAHYRVLTEMCRPFNTSSWAIDVANKIFQGTAAPGERDALAAYLRGRPSLSEKAWAAVRRSPVLVDRHGEAVAPADMVSSSARGAALLAPALHLPLPTDEVNESLKRLKFRDQVRGTDLVALAVLVAQGGEPPSSVRQALTRLPELLTRSVLAQLKSIRFLETASGALSAPTDAYIRTERTIAVLGEEAPFAVDAPASQLRKLGCRSEPLADDIVEVIAKLRESGERPTRPEVVSRALADALRRERRRPDEFRSERILWTGAGWEAPDDCLVGSEHRKTFLDAVTVLPDGQRDVGTALGANTTPTLSHWRRLIIRIGERYGSYGALPSRAVDVLRRAYRQLDGPPEGLPSDTKCLLDDRGFLHTLADALTRRIVINDHPALASAARDAEAPVAFADTADRRVAPFFLAAGAHHLSQVVIELGTECGPEFPDDDSLGGDSTLKRLQAPNFASAVVALVSTVSNSERALTAAALAARLARIDRIVVVDGIARRYRLAGVTVAVQAEFLLLDEQIVVHRVPGSFELHRAVAVAVAVLADPSSVAGQLLGDPIYFLLRCRSVPEIQRELQRRRIVWHPDVEFVDDAEDSGDDESSSLVEAIGRSVVRNALHTSSSAPVGDPPHAPAPDQHRIPRPPLPDLDDVSPRPAAPEGVQSERTPRHRSGGGFPSGWPPQDPGGDEEDRALGRRGEEIVLALERERVEKVGLSGDQVRWVAADAPFADHDIKSVDDDGQDLWVEVKSTTGRDGRFSWPGAEFRLAVRVRRRYLLYRIYEADTTSPSWICVRDPIGYFENGGLRLDLDRLVGDIGPLTTAEEDAVEDSGQEG